MNCWVNPWHYCVRNSGKKGIRMCSLSELVGVGKEEMRQNPCVFHGASPCFHFLPDLIWLLSPPYVSCCLFSILFCICSIRTTVFCFPFLHFHRQWWNGFEFVFTVFPRRLFLYWDLVPELSNAEWSTHSILVASKPFPKFCTRTQARKLHYWELPSALSQLFLTEASVV